MRPLTNKAGFRVRPLSAQLTSETGILFQARMLPGGTSKADPRPVVVPVRLPSIAHRMKLYEAAGAIKQAFYDSLDPADFQDYLDDLPEEGLTPHELSEHEIHAGANAARAARKKAEERIAKAKATPSRVEASQGPKATVEASDPAPKPD